MGPPARLLEVARLFALLGLIGFGGPAAHIALIRRETVERRAWVSERRLLDLIGMTSLIPGPNSTELAMLVGRERAGRIGLLVAGVAFIVPAATVVLLLAWIYVELGEAPGLEWLLYGIKPVVLAIVAAALAAFARTAVAGPLSAAIGVGAAAAWLLGVNELLLLAAGAVLMAIVRAPGGMGYLRGAIALPFGAGVHAASSAVDLVVLGGVFLKAGALLFGSGYVLLAYLRGDLVERLGWLTDAQLLDAVAIGQVTPGPLFTTATFIGYLLAGLPGALVATIAIFMPAFVFAGLIGPVADRLRSWRTTSALLDGLNAAAIGLMAAVSLRLGAEAIVDPLTAALGVATLAALLVWRLPSLALVGIGAAIGLLAGVAGIGP